MTPPRQATPRNFDRPTFGGHIAAAAAGIAAGNATSPIKGLLPWQRYVADVAGEIDPKTGTFAYDTIVVTVQRQSGKTFFALAKDTANCLMGANRYCWYTAQSGQHASDRWLEMALKFQKSPLAQLAKPYFSNGQQKLQFINGSTIRPHPPTADALHSKQSDQNNFDEVWEWTEAQGIAMMQAASPTATTRRLMTGHQPQLWIFSTEGTAESVWFNQLLDNRCRTGDPSIAFFDWGIPADADPSDLDVVAQHHPGYGHLFDMDELRRQYKRFEDRPGEFARAFGNRRTGAVERAIPAAPWAAAMDMTKIPADARICLAAAVGMDGLDTAITASIVDDIGVLGEVIDHRPGTAWAKSAILDLAERWKAPIIVDKVGPSSALYDELARAGATLIEINSAGVTAACANVMAGVTAVDETGKPAPTWRYRPSHLTVLNQAAELATRRWINDGAWVWGRRASIGSISALEALTLGGYGAMHMPDDHGVQLFI